MHCCLCIVTQKNHTAYHLLFLSVCPWSFHISANISTEGKDAAPITAMRTEYIQSFFCTGRTDLKRNSIKTSQMVCGPATLKIVDKHKYTAASTGIRKLQSADKNHKLTYLPQTRKHRSSKVSFLQITKTIPKFLQMQGLCYISQHSRIKKKWPCKPRNPTTALKVLFISSSLIMYFQSQKFHRILNLKWTYGYILPAMVRSFIFYTVCVVFQLTWLMFLKFLTGKIQLFVWKVFKDTPAIKMATLRFAKRLLSA